MTKKIITHSTDDTTFVTTHDENERKTTTNDSDYTDTQGKKEFSNHPHQTPHHRRPHPYRHPGTAGTRRQDRSCWTQPQ